MRYRWIILILSLLSFGLPCAVSAQDIQAGSETSKYNIRIDIKEAYISGLCIIKDEGSVITASVVNEFGVSVITIRYDLSRNRIKIMNCIRQLRNPMIRSVLKKDFRILLDEYANLTDSKSAELKHINTKQDITYNLIPF